MPSSVDLPWLELEITAPAQAAPYLELNLSAAGFEGWVVESEEPLRWVHYLAQEGNWEERLGRLQALVHQEGGSLNRRGQIRDEDWAENWKAFYHPMKRRTVIITLSGQFFNSFDMVRGNVRKHFYHHTAIFQIKIKCIFRIKVLCLCQTAQRHTE